MSQPWPGPAPSLRSGIGATPRCGAGTFASNIGTWMETVGVGILVTASTGQAGWAGIVAAAGLFPNALTRPARGRARRPDPASADPAVDTTTVQTILAGTLAALASVGGGAPVGRRPS